MMMGLIDFDPILYDKSPSRPSTTISGLFGKVDKSSRHQAPLSFDALGTNFDGAAQTVSATIFGLASGVVWVFQALVIDPLSALTKEHESSGLIDHVDDIGGSNAADDDNVKGNGVGASILPRNISHNPLFQPSTPLKTKPYPATELTPLLNTSTEPTPPHTTGHRVQPLLSPPHVLHTNSSPCVNSTAFSNLNSSQLNPKPQPNPTPTQPNQTPTQPNPTPTQPNPTPTQPNQTPTQPNRTPPGYKHARPTGTTSPSHFKPLPSHDPAQLVTSVWQNNPMWSTQLGEEAHRTHANWEPSSLFDFKLKTSSKNNFETNNVAVSTKTTKINPYFVRPLENVTKTTSPSPPLAPTIEVPTMSATPTPIPPTTHATSLLTAITPPPATVLQEQTSMRSTKPTLAFGEKTLWRGASSWVSNIF